MYKGAQLEINSLEETFHSKLGIVSLPKGNEIRAFEPPCFETTCFFNFDTNVLVSHHFLKIMCELNN